MRKDCGDTHDQPIDYLLAVASHFEKRVEPSRSRLATSVLLLLDGISAESTVACAAFIVRGLDSPVLTVTNGARG